MTISERNLRGMQARRAEVIRVVSPGLFVDDGDDGYYLVLRSTEQIAGKRDDVCFYGPFSTAAQASFLAASARALGLTGQDSAPRSATEAVTAAAAATAITAARVRSLHAP